MTSSIQIQVTPGLDEDRVWKESVEPHLSGTAPNVLSICRYGVTEMVNNVLDHSESDSLSLGVERERGLIRLTVEDRGIGIFRKIKESLDLETEHSAAIELTKGRVTTDPDRHTGEGIFFTARMFDFFTIRSGTMALMFQVGERDWWYEGRDPWIGTSVWMEISEGSSRATREVFDQYAAPGADFQFDTTVLSMRLSAEGGRLVSRSQAKRLLGRLGRFKTVVLNFEGVTEVGPAFADEVFRVFQNEHPEIRIVPLNANEFVNRMILRAVTRNGVAGEDAAG